jgi:hypothetical protein
MELPVHTLAGLRAKAIVAIHVGWAVGLSVK